MLFYSTVTYGYSQKPTLRCGRQGEVMRPVDISELVPTAAQLINRKTRAVDAAEQKAAT
jgi:hypothetical protein